MWMLSAGLILFLLPHLVRELGLREPLRRRLPSEGAYKGLYSLVALAGLGLIILGKSRAPFIMIWEPPFELRYISHLLMIPAFMLVLLGNLPPSYLRRVLGHPMLLGVCLWGAAHLWANGDLASMLLFGSFTVWAAFKFIALSRSTSASARPPAWKWDITAVVAGLLGYVIISVFHGQLFGVGLNFV